MRHRAPRRSAALPTALVSGARRVHRVQSFLFRGLTLLTLGALIGTVAAALAPGAGVSAKGATLTHGASYRVPTAAGSSAAAAPVNSRRHQRNQQVAGTSGQQVAGTSGQQVAGTPGQQGGDHRRTQPAVQTPNPDCTLVVPDGPTSATGLATPYQLVATDPGAGACHETNTDQSAFVEAAILDPATGQVSIYHPVVVDQGTAPAVAPVPVRLPAGAVVGVWFGFNGGTLTLDGPGAGSCVNGLPGSPFGQFAYCHASEFFAAANSAIASGKLRVPPLGTASDGLPCPTTRSFFVVDQDQSDNLATTYRVVDGEVAQNTAATRAGTPLTNGSDEGLLARAIDPALGCTPFQAPDLTDGGALTPALALNELSAAAFQAAPVALTPTSDPMTLVDGAVSIDKTNLYRAGVDQPPVTSSQESATYCTNMLAVAQARLARDASLLQAAPSPVPGSASLFDFLTTRLATSATNLQCSRADR